MSHHYRLYSSMLVLFETSAGYAIFKLLDESKLKNVDNIWEEFSTAEKAQQCLKLVAFKKFKDTAEALDGINHLNEGKLGKTLKKVLRSKMEENENLAVGDTKLGNIIKEKLDMQCVSNAATAELMRGIRAHVDSLLGEHKQEMAAMNLALAHSLGRYKVKFDPDKIDTMIVQAVSLLDDIDKELNNYIMRCREWYGWHFPELGKIVQDHQAYAKVVRTLGMRQNAEKTDLSSILSEELETRVKDEAEISTGCDISESDLLNIKQLCDQVIAMSAYRAQLADYLKNRMAVLAPNLTALLGELVGARLISHAGSLMNLAKYPASTVQILGAEKALFRALKTKRDTPKYGIIYHAQLIGQASARLKGKLARKLAAKVSLATRIDALGDEPHGAVMGTESRAYLEAIARSEQERGSKRMSGVSTAHEPYHFKNEILDYDTAADSTVKERKRKTFADQEEEQAEAGTFTNGGTPHKRFKEEIEEAPGTPKEDPKKKRIKVEEVEQTEVDQGTTEQTPKEKHKKKKKAKKSQDEEDE
uniref:Nop domain-containing protein n=2 Tax=Parascaris univalens TaxID=6257 RepID=A0A915BQ07_PARUN